jgi:hypothetical protein
VRPTVRRTQPVDEHGDDERVLTCPGSTEPMADRN